jgi:hypothetical protein
VSLSLLKQLSSLHIPDLNTGTTSLSESQLHPRLDSLTYLSSNHLAALKSMQLLNRGRLSVQSVNTEAWEAVNLMGKKGGWEQWDSAVRKKKKSKPKAGSEDVEGNESEILLKREGMDTGLTDEPSGTSEKEKESNTSITMDKRKRKREEKVSGGGMNVTTPEWASTNGGSVKKKAKKQLDEEELADKIGKENEVAGANRKTRRNQRQRVTG